MANNNIPQGSKWNPYTHSEFQSKCGTDSWHGGWFEYNGLKYCSSNGHDIYSNRPILGSKNNPFPWGLYQEMILFDELWCGGWVVRENPNDGLSYYVSSTSVGMPQYDNNMNDLGSEAYPI